MMRKHENQLQEEEEGKREAWDREEKEGKEAERLKDKSRERWNGWKEEKLLKRADPTMGKRWSQP